MNIDAKALFLEILKCDTSNEVFDILKKYDLWDLKHWRKYGDAVNSAGTVLNQQSEPEKALLEKVTNSIDAVLTSECLSRGINPKNKSEAPNSMNEAVSKYFTDKTDDNYSQNSDLAEWEDRHLTNISKSYISLFVTGFGAKSVGGKPCINLYDAGEGQTPSEFPNTFFSLANDNKMKIFFVQGKFNMGGSGALTFCENNLQLIVSKRNKNVLEKFPSNDPRKDEWGFSVTREFQADDEKSPKFYYLAPIKYDQSDELGEVLSFKSEKLPLKPEINKPYHVDVEYGSLIKLYEYDLKRKSNILKPGELQNKLELNLPQSALPIRIHECRPQFKGKGESSFVSNIVGLQTRISRNRGDVLEEGFPISQEIKVEEEEFLVHFFAFKENTYSHLGPNGIIFTMNGQNHGEEKASVFSKKKIRLSYISQSILVIVDCSKISNKKFSKLFMANREQVKKSAFYNELLTTVEDLIAKNDAFRKLAQERQSKDQNEKFANDKAMEQIFDALLKKSKTLQSLFPSGQRLSSAFAKVVKLDTKRDYELKLNPSFFKFYKYEKNEPLSFNLPINKSRSVKFSTDVENDYFIRYKYKGKFSVYVSKEKKLNSYISKIGPLLHEGLITFQFKFPEGTKVGEQLNIEFHLFDTSMEKPFVLKSKIKATAEVTETVTRTTPSIKHPNTIPRQITGQPGNDRETQGGLSLPKLQWKKLSDEKLKFDQYSCLDIEQDSNDENGYLWYINEDNIYLQTELKQNSKNDADAKTIKEQFKISLALFGIAILNRHKVRKIDDFDRLKSDVRSSSEGIAPVMHTIIDKIKQLELPDEEIIDGED